MSLESVVLWIKENTRVLFSEVFPTSVKKPRDIQFGFNTVRYSTLTILREILVRFITFSFYIYSSVK